MNNIDLHEIIYNAPALANFCMLVLLFFKITRVRMNLQKMADYHMKIMYIHRDMDKTIRHIVKWNNIIARMVKISMELLREHEGRVSNVTDKADHVIDVVNKLSQRLDDKDMDYKGFKQDINQEY
jgi:hypothetical protein